MSPNIEIVAATEQHAQEFARLDIVANAHDEIFIYACPHDRNATPAQQSEHLRWRTERMGNCMQSAGTYWFRAVDVQTGRTVGVTGVLAPRCDTSGWIHEPTEAIDGEKFAQCEQLIEKKRTELLGNREDVWLLTSMAVHPDYQGQGIGSNLLAEICNLADKSSQDIYLESTPAGLRLYQKTGFESLETWELFDRGYRLTFMLRKSSPVS